ncbi:MAG: hypothetical protein CSB24_03870 [Deltaproteobacteria bacterium]|nr:MAG: hypothetical protein CSB24_03870 [Deltaproteobacteria bacterium]
MSMKYYDFTHIYSAKVSCPVARQQVIGQSLPGGVVLWQSIAKTAAVFAVILLVFSMTISSFISKNSVIVDSAQEEYRAVMDEKLALEREKTRLFSAEQVELAASKKLGLVKINQDRIYRLY